MRDWTPAEAEVVTKLWRDGHSASQIAAQLQDRSRNAVIGFIHRHMPQKGKRSAAPVERAKPHPMSIAVGRSNKTVRGGKPAKPIKSRPTSSPDVMKPEAAPQPPAASGIHPAPRMVALVELSEQVCKWPVGDPLQPGFGFCGHSVDKAPYCAAHARIAFVPVHDRRRAA